MAWTDHARIQRPGHIMSSCWFLVARSKSILLQTHLMLWGTSPSSFPSSGTNLNPKKGWTPWSQYYQNDALSHPLACARSTYAALPLPSDKIAGRSDYQGPSGLENEEWIHTTGRCNDAAFLCSWWNNQLWRYRGWTGLVRSRLTSCTKNNTKEL